MSKASSSKAPTKNSETKKRAFSDLEVKSDLEPPKKKVFPIFNNSSTSEVQGTTPFMWEKHPLLSSTCLYGTNLAPKLRPKIAAFDLDGTIIHWSPSYKDDSFKYWHTKVPRMLKEAHDQGYSVVVFSNQNIHEKKLPNWRSKIASLARALHEVPFTIFAALAKDGYRKPMPGMWLALERIAQDSGIQLDKENSFFVGDAAGRKGDYSGTDRKFAENLRLKFLTPEEHFLQEGPREYKLQGTHVRELLSRLDNGSGSSPQDKPTLLQKKNIAEMIIFVGPPASGKSTYYNKHFEPAGYAHVNQDKLGSRPRCLKLAEEQLKDGVSCVIDNTNRDKKTRELYVQLAKSLGVPIRCFIFRISKELAWHNNLYRTYCLPFLSSSDKNRQTEKKLVPYSAIAGFESAYEEPTMKEGFDELKFIKWRPDFEGDAVKEQYWDMWLQIDGK